MAFFRDWQEFLAQFLPHINTFRPGLPDYYEQIKVVIHHFSNSILHNSGVFCPGHFFTYRFSGSE